MASKVPPINAMAQYVDTKTPSGLSQLGVKFFADLQAQQGVFPTQSTAPNPAKSPAPGTHVFVPETNTLHVFNGTDWKSVELK